MQLEKTYRAYLIRKLSSRDSPAGRLIVGDAEEANWLLPILPAALICWAFSLKGASTWLVLAPTLAVSFAGICYVLWVRTMWLKKWRKEHVRQEPRPRKER
jgi:uncharacterized membrane protein YbhN (UPF0104 family)